MSTYRLEKIFTARHVVLAGASPREKSLGAAVLREIREGGFAGHIEIVNPNHRNIEGLATVPSLAALSTVPDLLVVTAPPSAVPKLIAEAGEGYRPRWCCPPDWDMGRTLSLLTRSPPHANTEFVSSALIVLASWSPDQTERQLRAAASARRRPCPYFAVGSHCRRFGRVGVAAETWILSGRLARRSDRYRFRGPHGLFRA